MNKIFVSAFLIIISSSLCAGTCEYTAPGILNEKNEIMVSCDSAVIALKSDPKGEEEYRKNLDDKLAKDLAIQTKQILNDLGSSSDFFEQSSENFILSNEVKNSCRFQFFSEFEKKCGDKELDGKAKERLSILTNALGKLSNYKPKNLMDSILHIYGSNKYGSNFEEGSNQCPALGNEGVLRAQVTREASEEIIRFFNSKDNQGSKEFRYESHPQLALISNVEKYYPGIKAQFETYLSTFQKEKHDPKQFLQAFFFNQENMKKMSFGVANRCKQLQASVTSFVCHPVKNLASTDPLISKKLFNNYNPNKDYQDQKASVKDDPLSFKTFAYLCQHKKNNKSGTIQDIEIAEIKKEFSCDNLKKEDDNTVDNYFRCFNAGVRAEGVDSSSVEAIANFCERYSCIAKEVKETPSCKAGGPLSSKDLAELKLVDDRTEGHVQYLASLEKHKTDKANFLAYMEATSAGRPVNTSIKKNISEFDMNAFGAEGMTKLIGLPQNQQSVILVAEHMSNSGIKPTSPDEINRIVSRSNFDVAVAAMDKANGQIPEKRIEVSPIVASNYNFVPAVNHYEVAQKKVKNDFNSVAAQRKKSSHDVDETEQMIKDLKTLMDSTNSQREAKKENKIDTDGPKNPDQKAADTNASVNLDSEMKAWASRLASQEDYLRQRENYANTRDVENWRTREDLDRREAEISAKNAESKNGRAPASVSAGVPSKNAAELSLRDLNAVKNKADADLAATPAGLTVTAERLEKLNKDDLKENKVNTEEPFVISVRLKSKLVHVRVTKFKNGNRTYLAPYLNEDNMEVKEAILKSPIFREFRYFLEQKEMAYTPVKKIRS